MHRTIENLWNGNIVPAKDCGVGDPEVEELIVLMERNKETLIKMLDSKQKENFEKYLDCEEEYIWLLSMHAFRDGFCLAGKLMAEVFSDDT